jgi:hypothetical protein
MAIVNQVSQPPLTTPISDSSGTLNRAWAIWFRDLYVRTSFKGGNSIDENKALADEELLALGSSLEETITAVNENEQTLNTHIGAEQAHGSNGNIIGDQDFATVLLFGLVKQMAQVANAVDSTVSVDAVDATISTVSVDSPDVVAAPVAYDQTFTDTIVTLINELKADVNQVVTDVNPSATLSNEIKSDVNQLVIDLNDSIAQLNELLSNSQTSGQMTT